MIQIFDSSPTVWGSFTPNLGVLCLESEPGSWDLWWGPSPSRAKIRWRMWWSVAAAPPVIPVSSCASWSERTSFKHASKMPLQLPHGGPNQKVANQPILLWLFRWRIMVGPYKTHCKAMPWVHDDSKGPFPLPYLSGAFFGKPQETGWKLKASHG